jgi:hypothetical protein
LGTDRGGVGEPVGRPTALPHDPRQHEPIIPLAPDGLNRRRPHPCLPRKRLEQSSRPLDTRVLARRIQDPPGAYHVVHHDDTPGRVSRNAQARYSGLLGLSASMKTRSNGPRPSSTSLGRVSRARPTRTSTRFARPARAMFVRATSACLARPRALLVPGAAASAADVSHVARRRVQGEAGRRVARLLRDAAKRAHCVRR